MAVIESSRIQRLYCAGGEHEPDGPCWDNAVAESSFATLERELIDRHDWPTRAAARQAIFRYIETWYNSRRRQSTLGCVSRAEYEARLGRAA